MSKNSLLLSNYKLTQKLELKNRIIMAPMTRAKAQEDHMPTKEMAKYYARRADAGLIITEGTLIRPDASGYSNVPGIYSQKQIEAWQKIAKSVHLEGGKIFMQLWHVGRVSHPTFLNGNLPISASETTMNGRVRRFDGLFYGKSRAVTKDEIQGLIHSYVAAARNAISAGFDGIELHGANGYLIDQFLHYDTNRRIDDYGGTPENMARFALEIVRATANAIGYHKVGIRLSPGAYLNEIVGDPRDKNVFSFLLNQINHFPIAYVHTGNFDDKATFKELNHQTMTQFMRKYYSGNLIASGGYEVMSVEKSISKNKFDLVSVGRPFIANPDLVNKIKQRKKLQSYDPAMLEILY